MSKESKVTARLLAWATRWVTVQFLRWGMPMEGWFKEKSLLPWRCLKGNQVEISSRELDGVTWESR